ncbi:MAG: hypothetical protein V4685_13390 [Bacteroidota bacterium]
MAAAPAAKADATNIFLSIKYDFKIDFKKAPGKGAMNGIIVLSLSPCK